jgi:hypothetical protein
MSGTVQVTVDREFQGTLRFILEEAARQYHRSAEDPNSQVCDATRSAWRANRARCLEVAAQLRRT